MEFNSAFKELKLKKKTGNGRLNNLNDPVLNVLKSGCSFLLSWSLSSHLRVHRERHTHERYRTEAYGMPA